MKLAIGLPISDDKVYTQFFLSFVALDKPEGTVVLYPKTQFHTSDIGKVRDSLCVQAIEAGCTHLLMMDTDQVYHDEDIIKRLLDHRKDIVCGKVHRRYPPFEPILNIGRKHVSDELIEKGGLIEVDATGTGCMMIDLDVLRAVEMPWFNNGINDEGGVVGEDVNFCYKAKEKGFKVFVDCDVTIGHIALVQVGQTLYNVFKKLNKVK